MSASSGFQILRGLQAVHGLQANSCLPVTGFLLLARFSLADVLVKVEIALFEILFLLAYFDDLLHSIVIIVKHVSWSSEFSS